MTYYLMVVTPEFLSEKKDTVEQIKEAVVEWDVMDDEGKRIPPLEIADRLPVTF
ncbi:MAG: hypothetical protein LLG42_16285 [Chloroflexi bacterium]|nr:hypothetical protein [Chloroflexota bacterium]